MAFFALMLIASVKQLLISAKAKLNIKVKFNNALKVKGLGVSLL
jgi:hypothetical protein